LQALKGQQDRDNKIKTLLLTIVDVLGFVEEVDALSKIRKLEDTVSSMMKQIYQCALFIQTYGEKGLASTYRQAFSGKKNTFERSTIQCEFYVTQLRLPQMIASISL
jgi:hypothetical protein